MYAVIETGSKQYKVAKDDIILIEKLDVKQSRIQKRQGMKFSQRLIPRLPQMTGAVFDVLRVKLEPEEVLAETL